MLKTTTKATKKTQNILFSGQKGSSVFDEPQWGAFKKNQIKTTNKKEAGVEALGDSGSWSGVWIWSLMHVTASSMWCENQKGRCRRPVQQGPRGQFPLEATCRNHCRVFAVARKEKKKRQRKKRKKGNACAHMKVQFALCQGASLSPCVEKKHTIKSGSESNTVWLKRSGAGQLLTTRASRSLASSFAWAWIPQ